MEKRLDRNKRGTRTAILITAVCLVLIAGVLIYDAVGGKTAALRSDTAMGTVVTAKVWGPSGEKTAQDVLDRIKELDGSCFSNYNTASDVARINAAPGSEVSVHGDTASLLSKLLILAAQTDGAVDPTVGRLVSLWDIGGANERVPSPEEIRAAVESIGWDRVQVTADTVRIGQGQALDLGAFGKGAACDAVRTILEGSRARSAVVSVGGSILLYGENPDGGNWPVGIRDPRGGANDRLGTLSIGAGQCLSTSGDYERYFELDGVRYCHILDPGTGYPADSGLMSVTVISPSGLVSDALSTACFVLGYEKSLPILEQFQQAQAVFVTTDRQVRTTAGLSGAFTLTAEGYAMESEP